MILLNFSHPLTDEQVKEIEAITGQKVAEVRSEMPQFNHQQPFVPQAEALAEACQLTPQEWQTTPLLVVPPALNFIAVVLLAELHGRMGYFPPVVRLRPLEGRTPTRYQVAEVVNLQQVRDDARTRRQGE